MTLFKLANRFATVVPQGLLCMLAVCLPNRLPAQTTAPTLAGQSAPAPAPTAEVVPAWARDGKGQVIPSHDEHQIAATPAPPGLYVALGDSITYGTGVEHNCSAFPTHPVDIAEYCPDGASYAILVAKALRDAGVAGHFMNLGINGAKVERVIADELPWLPADATVVTLYIGTNDSRAVRSPIITMNDVVQRYEASYDQLLQMIHDRAPGARIVLVNFPNEKYLAATYHVEPDVLPRYDAVSQVLDVFINAHCPRYAVADTICNPASYDNSLLYKGNVHPNEAGAVILSQSVTRAILAKDPQAPPQSCQWFDAGKAAGLAAKY